MRVSRNVIAVAAALTAVCCSPAQALSPGPAPVTDMGRWCAAPTWHYAGPPRWEPDFRHAVRMASHLSGMTLVEAGPQAGIEARFTHMPMPGTEVATTTVYADATNLTGAEIAFGPATVPYVRTYPVRQRHRMMTMLMLHEIGHALGLGHTATPGEVMSPILGATHMTDDDRTAFASTHPTC